MALEIIISGLVIGILFGWILQRGRLCFNSGIRDPFLFKEYSVLKAIFLALSLSMIGFAIMAFTGIVTLAPKPLIWPNQIIGGFVFGMGMVLAAACASGVTYKTGEGIMTAFVALLGLALGAVTAASGFLSGVRLDMEAEFSMGAVMFGGDAFTNQILMLILGIVFTAILMWKWFIPSYTEWKAQDQGSIKEIFLVKGWPWFVTGIAFTILNCVAWVLSAAAGRNYPLGITAGWLEVLNSFTTGAPAFLDMSWLPWVVLGVIFGSFIGAKGAKEYKMSSPKTGKPIMLGFIGGLMLGVGAVFGKGCNIGNLMSGVPQLSAGSWLFSGFLILGVWFMAFLIFKLLDKPEILE